MIRRSILFFLFTLFVAAVMLTPMQARAADLEPQAGIVTTATDPLNVRSSASTGASVLTMLPKGSYVTLLSQSGNWWYVEYANGRYGYCYGAYITPVESTVATVATKTDPLNVRRGPGTSYTWQGSLPKGSSVLVLSRENGWCRVLYQGTKTGYASAQYLSERTDSTQGKIQLQVPDFKQTDSRWANVKLGTSGGTIGKIGCATTAIAMMESYRQGTVIYPDAMSKRLNYTASGSVYWPADYVMQSGGDYLQNVYSLLKQGKPVLIGATNRYGGQHYVVITGYTGGETLTASGFTIHDPGSNSRTNLQQFFNAYPNLYKYFYYR